ncbi:hypothetical protein [Thiolapillus sp.]|nr:hypothetical protein [Thiolapillus sp.]
MTRTAGAQTGCQRPSRFGVGMSPKSIMKPNTCLLAFSHLFRIGGKK